MTCLNEQYKEDRGHSCVVANVAVRGMQFAVTELGRGSRGLVSSMQGQD